ncbi:ABC1 kinase family protein [Sagittula sp. SSi028]|uniref:ABC1 kinase family protein n=1 Tax=Sagittula sp. SSi028 TaxID=3400636 RepID=UPI003AF63852
MSTDDSRPVPQSRLARAAGLGRLTTATLANAAVTASGQLIRGQRPDARSSFVTPANITRLTRELSRMRGAAMKLGQLMSMESADMLPPELAQIMARLRAEAAPMPPAQLKQRLVESYGSDFRARFTSFDPRPIAAASIGQVHRATARDGRKLALKIQYPGIRQSIDSDIANLGSLLRLSRLLPADVDLDRLLGDARDQLHAEADYLLEARNLRQASTLLDGTPDFIVPTPHEDLSTPHILAMGFIDSHPLEETALPDQASRDLAMTRLFDLFLRELFDWGVVQTDPNLANYRIDPAGRLVLLDYGAARDYATDRIVQMRQLLRATITGDGFAEAMADNGYTAPDTTDAQWDSLHQIAGLVKDALSTDADFNFADTRALEQARRLGQRLTLEQGYSRLPPTDVLLLQRKLAGLVLMATRLGAQVPLGRLVKPYL